MPIRVCLGPSASLPCSCNVITGKVYYIYYPKAGNTFAQAQNKPNFFKKTRYKRPWIYFLNLFILFRVEIALEVLKFCQ